ncbi:right-handed parallel beta-helix repeat-containing protein [Rhodobacteraceae bacterium F11138]|nr:right-handed parallel beta-helix repeat-containing protein [Rhodobacteraceae bacterium F11138]
MSWTFNFSSFGSKLPTWQELRAWRREQNSAPVSPEDEENSGEPEVSLPSPPPEPPKDDTPEEPEVELPEPPKDDTPEEPEVELPEPPKDDTPEEPEVELPEPPKDDTPEEPDVDSGTGPAIEPVSLAKGATTAVDGGRVTIFAVEATQSIASIQITDGPAHGNVTVNPDNTLALVMSGSDYSGSLSFDFEISYANGSIETRSAALDVAAPEQDAGWGEGKHYMLETDAQGDLIIETGDNHRKVYVSESNNALTRADIADREGVSEGTVTGKWLMDHPEYGGSEDMALAKEIGIELWEALLYPTGGTSTIASHWLLFEKGYTYEDAGRLIGGGASGESPLHPLYVSSWGEGDRPVLTDSIRIFQLESRNVVFDDIAPQGGVLSLGGQNIIVNNSQFANGGGMVNIQNTEGFTLRDSDLSHILNPAQANGYWGGGGTAFYSKETNGILMENNIFHHNGWEDDYLPDGSTEGGVPPSMFAHGVYLQNTTSDVTARDNIISQSSSVGAQFRGGAFIEDNIFVDNNVATNMMGGIYEGKGDGPIGNFTFFTDNVVTSGAHKEWTHGAVGGRTLGVDVKAINTTLLDNIIAHLADPDNPEEQAQKTVTHAPLTIHNGTAYDDTIIYNWAGSGPSSKIVENNTPELDTGLADQTTIQRFAADVLGQNKATIAELMEAIRAGEVDVTADDIIAYFQNGFGIDASGDGSATSHRFIPNALADGIRWDNRINWNNEEVPDDGDSADLSGNHVQYGGTTRIDDLDLGGGALYINSGKLSVQGTLASTGEAGLIQTINAGQFWTNGYSDSPLLTIEVDGGRFANTGAITGQTLLHATDGQTLLATSGASYTLTDGSQLIIDGSDARVGFDGEDNGTAALEMRNGSILTFKSDADGFSTIEEFRSGAWNQADSPVNSTVTLDGTLRIDLSDYDDGAGSYTLITVDELLGQLDTIEFVGLGNGLDAELVVDHVTDIVRLDISSGIGQGLTDIIDDIAPAAGPTVPELVDDIGLPTGDQNWLV